MLSPNRISARQLKGMLHDGHELALLDVREAGQFGESHLLFATPLPYSRLELDIGALVPRKSAPLVVCDDGALGIAERAAERLRALGYTDVAVLDGGTKAWAAAGLTLFAGVNVPSKTFGELVEHAYHTPRISARELVRMKESGEDVVILDGRPWSEYTKMTIPGSTCCPNAELPYRALSIVTNPTTKVVVNCAGRTRSIIGAQTLINFGVPNPVYALENGTQGWFLADLELERGASRRYPEEVDAALLPGLREAAAKIAARFGVPFVNADEAARWLRDAGRTTYLCDVRTAKEFEAGSIPGAVHAPGGQLIQATDQWVGVRNARIVLIDSEGVRAPVVATWLKQLGCDVHVLEEGIACGLAGIAIARPTLPDLPEVSAQELKAMVDAGTCTVFDLGPSMSFRKAHIPGSRWSIRPKLGADAKHATGTVVLTTDDPDVARLASTELVGGATRDIRLFEGGTRAWQQAGHPTASSPSAPPDRECIDFLFFVHDRHAGNRAAMEKYLAWETGLMAQLDGEDKSAFRVGVPG